MLLDLWPLLDETEQGGGGATPRPRATRRPRVAVVSHRPRALPQRVRARYGPSQIIGVHHVQVRYTARSGPARIHSPATATVLFVAHHQPALIHGHDAVLLTVRASLLDDDFEVLIFAAAAWE